MKQKVSETDIAKPVVDFLKDLHFDVYQEVKLAFGVADIVAVRNGIVWVIESKTAFGLKVIEQAERWRRYAHFVSVAVPYIAGHRNHFARRVCETFGIGILSAYGQGFMDEVIVSEPVKAKLNRHALAAFITDKLCEEHKTFSEAGTNTGKRWSPFQATCRNIREFVAKNQGCSYKDLLENVSTHYKSNSTAKSLLSGYIEQGVVEGVRIERDGRRMKFYSQ